MGDGREHHQAVIHSPCLSCCTFTTRSTSLCYGASHWIVGKHSIQFVEYKGV